MTMARQNIALPIQSPQYAAPRPTAVKLGALIKLGRLTFLPYSAVLFGLGTTIALYRGLPISLGRHLYGQVFIWCVHLMTHYCNEYFDLEADRANLAPTKMTGGSRVLVEGLLSPMTSLCSAILLLLSAVGLLYGMSTGARWIGGAMIALAWFYTAPPLRFNYRGLGELTVSLVLNVLAPLLGYHLQAGSIDAHLAIMLLPAAIIQTIRMMIMNLMDYEGDLAVGKKTLATLIGRRRVKHVYFFGQAVAYALSILFVRMGLPRLVLMFLALTLPLSIWQGVRLWREEERNVVKAGSIAFWASSHVALVVVSVSLGLVGSRLRTTPGAFNGEWLLCASIPVFFVCLIALKLLGSNRKLAGE